MAIDTTHLDADADKVKLARPAILASAQMLNDLETSDVTKGAKLIRWLLNATGAVGRWVADKLAERVSVMDFGAVGDGVTSDQAAVAAAVAHCYSAGDWLYWPDGTYLTTASIPNFHDVKHVGPGAVKRGSGLFYVDPDRQKHNQLYVATTGDDANDGLSSSQPRRTIQGAVNAIVKFRPVHNRVTINVAAGTYNESVLLPDYQIQSDSFFTVKGPATASVVTPGTFLLDGTGISANSAFDGGRGNKFKIENILYTNWNTSANTDCTITGVGSYSWLVNNQSLDGTARSLALIDRGGVCLVEGGGKDGGQMGFDCYSGSTLTVGYRATEWATSTFVRNTTQCAFYAKSHVHIVSNYGNYTDNVMVVWGYHNSRYDTKGDYFARNTRVFRLQGSYVSENIIPASEYNYGTADANTIVWELDQYSAMDLYHAGGRGGLDVAHQRQSTTINGTASATLARELKTVNAHSLTTTGRYIEVECVVAGAGATGTKTVQLRLGATVIGTYTIAAGSVTGKFRALIWANNSTSVVVTHEVTGLTLVSAVRASPAVDMTVDQSLAVWLTVPGAGDTATLHEARCVLWG